MHSFLIDSNKKFIATPLRGVPRTQSTTSCVPLAALAHRRCLTHRARGLRAPSGPLIRDIRSHPTSKPYPKRQRGHCFTAGPHLAEYKFIKGKREKGSRASPQKAEPKEDVAKVWRAVAARRRATALRRVVPTAAAMNTAGARTRTHGIGDC